MPLLKYDYEEEHIKPIKKKLKTKQAPAKKTRVQTNARKKLSPQERIAKLNFALLCLGGAITTLFIVLYSIVAVSETTLSNLHNDISDLNYENIELENKLENVKSYYSVDTKVSSNASFEKAKNVIEVNQIDAKTINHKLPQNSNLNTVTGF